MTDYKKLKALNKEMGLGYSLISDVTQSPPVETVSVDTFSSGKK